LSDSLEVADTDILVKLLLAQGKARRTAWHVAVEGGHIELLEKLWGCFSSCNIERQRKMLERIRKWANEQLTREELNKFLFAQDNQSNLLARGSKVDRSRGFRPIVQVG
jgi:hypothetical protein